MQATYAPADWGELTVRAAWSPSCRGMGIDLEIQASRNVGGPAPGRRGDHPEPVGAARMQSGPTELADRVVRSRSRGGRLSYDGRESLDELRRLTTLPVLDVTAPVRR